MTGVTITVDDREVLDYLRRLHAKTGNAAPALDEIGAVLESRVHQRFDAKKDPSGIPWHPWARSTAERRAKTGKGTLLEYTRHMRGSLSHQTRADRVEIGFGMPYAVYHEFGTKKMPRRGLLTATPDTGELGEDDKRTVLEILERFLAE